MNHPLWGRGSPCHTTPAGPPTTAQPGEPPLEADQKGGQVDSQVKADESVNDKVFNFSR